MPTSKNAFVDLVGKNIRCRITLLNDFHHDLFVSSVQCYIRRKKVAERKLYAQRSLVPMEVNYSEEQGVLKGDPELLCFTHIEFIFEKFIIADGEYLTLELIIEEKVYRFDIDAREIHSAKDWSKHFITIPLKKRNFNNN